MKILVTGGSGLVGKALQQLTECGSEADSWIYLDSSQYNLTSVIDIARMFSDHNPDVVVHLAANVGGLYKNMRDKVTMYEDNMTMGLGIISMARKHGVKRLICMCSTCVFPHKVDYPITEERLHSGEPHVSNEGYAYAKRMLELHCKLTNEVYGTEYICLIPTNVYGPHDNFNLHDGHVLPSLIHKCFYAKTTNTHFRVMGSGRPLRQFIFSTDLARFIIWCIRHLTVEIFSSKSYSIICAPDPEDEVSIAQLAHYIAEKFDIKQELLFDEDQSDGQHRKTCSNALMKRLCPDFQYTSLRDGISLTVNWFRDNFDKCRK